MNASMSQLMKRTILPLLVAAGFFALGTADASAHEVEYRPYYAPVHYSYARTRVYPAWLQRNREFRRWHFHNQYRFRRHASWIRIYDSYRFEKHHRRHGRRIHGKVYHEQRYRSYYPLPKNHRH